MDKLGQHVEDLLGGDVNKVRAAASALASLSMNTNEDGVEKDMFEYQGLMSCLVKVRTMDNNENKRNSSNATTQQQCQRYIYRRGTLSYTYA